MLWPGRVGARCGTPIREAMASFSNKMWHAVRLRSAVETHCLFRVRNPRRRHLAWEAVHLSSTEHRALQDKDNFRMQQKQQALVLPSLVTRARASRPASSCCSSRASQASWPAASRRPRGRCPGPSCRGRSRRSPSARTPPRRAPQSSRARRRRCRRASAARPAQSRSAHTWRPRRGCTPQGRPPRSCACRPRSAPRWSPRTCGRSWLRSRCPRRSTSSRSPRRRR
mmetsp:Transcript_73805/g.209047  ORF Transcript_73805/g.209047 Transcript_73805/m.209047 type:complete len:226 (-) Transcript_73805:920-1597(-)